MSFGFWTQTCYFNHAEAAEQCLVKHSRHFGGWLNLFKEQTSGQGQISCFIVLVNLILIWKWHILFIKIHFLAWFQGGRKKSLFLLTPLLAAINSNDSELCDNEIPPSSLRAGVTDLQMSGRPHVVLLMVTYGGVRSTTPQNADAKIWGKIKYGSGWESTKQMGLLICDCWLTDLMSTDRDSFDHVECT